MLYGARIIILAVLCAICIFVFRVKRIKNKTLFMLTPTVLVVACLISFFFPFEFEKQLFSYTNKYDIPYNQPKYEQNVVLFENEDNIFYNAIDPSQKAYVSANYINGVWYIRVITAKATDFLITDNLGSEFEKRALSDCWLHFAKVESKDMDINTYLVNIDGKNYTVIG